MRWMRIERQMQALSRVELGESKSLAIYWCVGGRRANMYHRNVIHIVVLRSCVVAYRQSRKNQK